MDSITELLATLGWREWILIIVLVMTVYFVFMVLRYMQLPRGAQLVDPNAPEIRTPPPEYDAPPGTVLSGVWADPLEPTIGPRPGARQVEALYGSTNPEPAAAPAKPAPEFAKHLEQAAFNADLRQVHAELSEARNEIQRLREEISQLQAAQHVSPLYAEAMSMANRGVDAAGIAGRCGISIAEAELVVALTRKP